MPTDQIFRRVVWYGLLLSAVDAISGRLLQAAPDPSVVLSLGATAWAAYRLAEAKATRLAFPAAMTLFIVYIAAFLLWARLLVGWNGSVPWRPPSATWMTMFVISAPIIALLAQFVGSRARAKAATEAVSHDH
jgi:ABC-type multidrug transport system fused ATPase/permease subunit